MTANMPYGDTPETWSDEDIIRKAKKAREDFEKQHNSIPRQEPIKIAPKQPFSGDVRVDPVQSVYDDDLSLKLANLARKMKLENPNIEEPSTRDLLIRALKEFNIDSNSSHNPTPYAEKFIEEHGHCHVAPNSWRNQPKTVCLSQNTSPEIIIELLSIIEDYNASIAFTLATMIDHFDLANQRIKELKLKLKRRNHE